MLKKKNHRDQSSFFFFKEKYFQHSTKSDETKQLFKNRTFSPSKIYAYFQRRKTRMSNVICTYVVFRNIKEIREILEHEIAKILNLVC